MSTKIIICTILKIRYSSSDCLNFYRYETTSTALAFITYCLAYHQDVQDTVREEINENIPDDVSYYIFLSE